MTHRLTPPRRRRAALLLVVAVLALLVGTGGPAHAHATVVASDPAEGAVLDAAPEQVRLTFSESVVGVPDGVQVLDARGGPVASTAQVRGAELGIDLTGPVGDGTLVVVWRVVSEDGHPVSGSLSFSVGAPSETVSRPATAAAGTTTAPLVLSIARWVGYAGLLVTGGLVAFVVLFLPLDRLTDPARRRLVAGARLAGATTVLAWLVTVPLVATYQLGVGVGALAEGATWKALSPTERAVTAGVLVGVAACVALLGGGRPSRSRGAAALVAGAAAVCAPALTGHTRAATPEWLAIGADALHLAAGGVWLGGLTALALSLPVLAGRGVLAAEALARFSTVAAGLLVALLLTGSLLTWRILGSWAGLVGTGYGRLLLLKALATLVVVALAAWNRFDLLPRLREATRRRERRAGAGLLVRSVVGEAVLLLAVVLATGFLVDRSPEAEVAAAAAGHEAGRTSGRLGAVEVQATVTPLTRGPNAVRLELRDPTGEPFEGLEAPQARLSSGSVDLGAVTLVNEGPGVYTARVVLPSSGTWQLQVSLRTTEFDNPVTTLPLVVSDG